jgi:hypothetical protein
VQEINTEDGTKFSLHEEIKEVVYMHFKWLYYEDSLLDEDKLSEEHLKGFVKTNGASFEFCMGK